MSDISTNEPGPATSVHWVDGTATPRDPVPADTLRGWIEAGHLPPETPVWWEGQADRGPASERMGLGGAAPQPAPPADAPDLSPPADGNMPGDPPEAPSAPQPPEAPQPMAPPAPMSVPHATTTDQTQQPVPGQAQPAAAPAAQVSALTADIDDQQLDDAFMGLVSRSYELYKETERATSVDEAFLGGVIAAFGDSGYVLIDIFTGGSVLTSSTASTSNPTMLPPASHELRFEDPNSGARVALRLDHLTPDVGSAKLLGQQARIEVGYGERVPNFGQVGRALRQEVASNFIVSNEPGRVSFDADLSSGFVYCEVDLLWELDRYVDEVLDVDADLLKLHLASVVHTLHKFLRLRFGG